MEEKELDYVLVPLGLTVFGVYHVWLLYSILRHPTTTVIALNADSRRQWVFSMTSDPLKNGVLVVQTIRNNIMASTLLATTAITLSSLISVFVSNSSSSSNASQLINLRQHNSNHVFNQVQFCYILWAIGCILLYPVSAEAMPNPDPEHGQAPKLRANQNKEILGGIVLFVILVGIFIWWFIRHWCRTRNRRIVDSFQLVSYPVDAAIAFEATECIICLEEFVEGVRLILLPCKHIYHPDCLRTWMISRRPHCPNCGRDYTSGGARRPAS
ncbi:hypothetical protein Vadar_006346 [Vaccinium darrowii]|uniref:Uncharacterized protein n=1 Tax=Vaccinium darrowii TaxID=229202 RepID=A0ACB7XFR5_9ERIC|nr:hypothetical protein Vadar_006346 [Vaccinium darrowii]